LLAALQNNQVIYWIGLFTSGLTAFYIFRLYFSIFWNKAAASLPEKSHGEGGFVTILPLVLLAIGAASTGFIPFGDFVTSDGKPLESVFHWQFSVLPVLMGLIGFFIAFWMYKKETKLPDKMAASFGGFYKASLHKFYFDEIYLFITKKIIFNLIGKPSAWFDRNVVNGLVNATGNTTEVFSAKIKRVQSGKVQQYAVYFLLATIVMAVLFIYWWK
jgi:NADH-quinone oxidoreductase subunit L